LQAPITRFVGFGVSATGRPPGRSARCRGEQREQRLDVEVLDDVEGGDDVQRTGRHGS
jgi:hypothetical protein